MGIEQMSLELEQRNVTVKTNGQIKEANELITARYNFTLLQLRGLFAIISVIDSDANTFFRDVFSIRNLAEAIGISTDKGYFREVKEILTALKNKEVIIMKRFDDNEEKRAWLETRFIADLEYFGDGTVEITMSPKLKKYFLELKNRYTFVELQEVLSFKSLYTIRIYLLMKQYISIGTRNVNINELKEILDLQDKYKSFADIRRFVIEPVIKEINEKTSMNLSYSADGRRGIRTSEIKFIIRKKAKELSFSKEKIQLLKRLKDNKVGIRRAEKLIKTYDAERIEENMNYVLTMPDITNIGAYIAEAIEGDYYAAIREMAATKQNKNTEHIKMLEWNYKEAQQKGNKENMYMWAYQLRQYGIEIKDEAN